VSTKDTAFCNIHTVKKMKSVFKNISLVQVDVVYEDEDGFVSAVTSLVASSKRPVILVTNNPHCSHLARFMDHHLVLNFSAPSSRRMSKCTV